MEQITVSDIVKATGGRLLCGEENLTLSHISTNSKEMAGADLFVPLIGELTRIALSQAHLRLGQLPR